MPGESSAFPVLLNVSLFAGLAQLQPVNGVLHQQLAGSFERIVLALRKPLPVLWHEDPAAIGMSGEVHAEHVIDLALEPVGGGPDAGHRWHRLLLADLQLDANAVP